MRPRILGAYVVLLTLSIGVSVVFIRQILLVRLEEEITGQLEQEVQEFRQLVGGNDPTTGEPFGTNLRAIFDVFFSRNVPYEGEVLVAILDGQAYKWKRATGATYPIEQEQDLVDRWATLTETEWGQVETPAGPARYLAVPVIIADAPRGTFVIANFPTEEREEIEGMIRVATAVMLAVLVVACLVAWGIGGRVLGPLRLLDASARSIGQSDLTARIPVRGSDEVSQLAATFNEMLDRLELAFATQQQFIDDAGHELRTPITIIRGHLELLEDDPEQRRQTIALVMDELDRMGRIVGDLLMLARAEQPDFLDLETVDVATLTDEVHAKASALAPRRWDLEATGRGRIVADRQRLTQAWVQLAQNAVTHTAEGQAVSLGSIVSDGQARFWVRDTGPGIAPEDQLRIFERFARGVNGRRSGGAGLGLAIVQAIAVAHHGSVELRSSPGAGATFTVVIPTDQPLLDPPVGASP